MKGLNNRVKIELSPSEIPRNWVFGEPTQTLDRFSRIVEQIYLPAIETVFGELEFEVCKSHVSVSQLSLNKKDKLFAFFAAKKEVQVELDRVVLDLRLGHPQNWMHLVSMHLPLVLLIRENLDATAQELVILLPEGIPQANVDIFTLSGFEVRITNSPVRGNICRFNLSSFASLRGIRTQLVTELLNGCQLQNIVCKNAKSWPEKVFTVHNQERAIINQDDCSSLLEEHGFELINVSQLGFLDQISLLSSVKSIVAVSGDYLSGLIFRNLISQSEYNLIEIESPEYGTNVYRTLAFQTRGNWAGVRGEYWPGLFDKRANFKNSIKDYTVSQQSISAALEYFNVNSSEGG